jgi:GT2 family glycosyltransferase
MTIAIVTPWWNHPELYDDYAEAVEDGSPDELLIVDNGSAPPLPFATVRLPSNRGFVGACNHGLHKATADIVVFLNNDVALATEGWLSALVRHVEPGVLCGPLRLDQHGDVNGQPMPYIDGWCLAATRSDLLRLGGFDPSFQEPAYYSDNDLCLRARLDGMTLREVRPGLYHKENVSQEGIQPAVAAASTINRLRFMDRAEKALAA